MDNDERKSWMMRLKLGWDANLQGKIKMGKWILNWGYGSSPLLKVFLASVSAVYSLYLVGSELVFLPIGNCSK